VRVKLHVDDVVTGHPAATIEPVPSRLSVYVAPESV